MKRHTIQGLAFVGVCLAAGGAIFFAMDLPKAKVSGDNMVAKTSAAVSVGSQTELNDLSTAATESQIGSNNETLIEKSVRFETPKPLSALVDNPKEFPPAYRGKWEDSSGYGFKCHEDADEGPMKITAGHWGGGEDFGGDVNRVSQQTVDSITTNTLTYPEAEDPKTEHETWKLDPSFDVLHETINETNEKTTWLRCKLTR